MMLQRRFLLAITLVAIFCQIAVAREWTDATGKFKTEAELVKVEKGAAFLKRQSDGVTIQVPLARLSAPDQAYLKSLSTPQPELVGKDGMEFPLGTANCVGLIVLDPKPVFEQEALSKAPLKDLLDQGVAEAGLDFRKLDRVTVLLLKPDLMAALASKQANFVAVAEFLNAVDPASMLSKIPAEYEVTTVAGKTCHKPAEAPKPWVCEIDEKTLAFSPDEQALVTALSATSDDASLAALLQTVDAKNEIRYVANLAPLQDLIVQVGSTLPSEAADAGKVLEVIKKIDSFAFTTDLDGMPSIELRIQVGNGVSPADMEKAIKSGLAKLPEMMETVNEAAAQQGPAVGGGAMNPAMATQMLGGMVEKMDEVLLFEQQEGSLKISVKFPSDAPPLIETLAQAAGFFAMMSQQSGGGGPFGAPE